MTTLSLIIRTLNEARYLDDLLAVVSRQSVPGCTIEPVVIDSGSTDATLDIAKRHNVRLTHITREEFSFGRALNRGCAFSSGDYLVFISGHCIPADEHWLAHLCDPLMNGTAQYSYGRQIADDESNFSERRVFAKYFQDTSLLPQDGFFCNNANAAICRDAWDAHKFDEDLTGLEDMDLAKRLVQQGGKVAYIADAIVFHHHQESWAQIRRRFQREAIALQQIMPEVVLTRFDTLKCIVRSVYGDWYESRQHGNYSTPLRDMWRYRYNQYVGSYIGNHERRRLSRQAKQTFFYPETYNKEAHNAWLTPNRRPSPYESKQSESEG